MYKIDTEEFSGPIEKLLELIEKKKLDITRINLAYVTSNFLIFVESIEKEINNYDNEGSMNKANLSLLSDFLVVASRLVLIKAIALMPSFPISEEDENEIGDLEDKLRFYSSLKPIFFDFDNMWKNSNMTFSRKIGLPRNIIFTPSKEISLDILSLSFSQVIRFVMPLTTEHKKISRNKISLEQTISRVLRAINHNDTSFSGIIDKGSRQEIVVVFLALLYLLRDNLLVVKQEKLFDDIGIKKLTETPTV